METNEAKMFVRSLNNSTAKILMAFILARTALDVQELRDWTGLKRETIYDGLDTLRSIGKIEKQTLAHGRTVWLPAGDLLPGFQMSEKRTPELEPAVQESEKRTSGLSRCPDSGHLTLVGGGESTLTLNTQDSSTTPQESEKRTSAESDLPSAIQILERTPLLFDGAVVLSRGLGDRDPLDVLAWCTYAYSQRSRLSGPGGLVRARLLKNEQPPEWARRDWREKLPKTFLQALGLIELRHGSVDDDEDLDQITFPLLTPEPSVQVPIDADCPITAEGAWQMVQQQLSVDIPRGSYETWVRDTKAIRYDGNVLSIGTRNDYARDWLEDRLQSTVERLLVGVMKRSVEVEFIVAREDSWS